MCTILGPQNFGGKSNFPFKILTTRSRPTDRRLPQTIKQLNHTTTMKLTCAARHLCALSDVPIPSIKLPGNKSDTSPSAPDYLYVYRKNKYKEISEKQKASNQASIKAFFNSFPVKSILAGKGCIRDVSAFYL
jgi:transcriptional regulator of met regulon